MSLLGNLFGRSFDALLAEGRAYFERDQFGPAKIALEKALAKAKGAPPDSLDEVREMVRAAKHRLAEQRIADADACAASRDLASAVSLLEDALEICDDASIRDAVHNRFEQYEAEDTRRLVSEVDEIDDDELMTIIAGTWTDPQADEYAALPDTFRTALLSSHDGDHENALGLLQQIADQSDLDIAPRYLYLELGRAALLAGEPDTAVTHLDRFLEKKDDAADADLQSQLAACDLKAGAFTALEQWDAAESALREACRLAPENHTVYLKLGIFLRSRGRFDASVTALERSRELMGQMHPDFSVIRELGFTYLAMGDKAEATACLGAVIEHLASRGQHDQFDPETAVALATLHEERGDYIAAADLYRHLSVGYDTENHFAYNLQAARLIRLSGGAPDLSARYLTRARELAASKAERALLEETDAVEART